MCRITRASDRHLNLDRDTNIMKRILTTYVMALLLLQGAIAEEPAIDIVQEMEKAFAHASESVSPSIVSIMTYSNEPTEAGTSSTEVAPKVIPNSSVSKKSTTMQNGSGLVLSADGYIVCSNHLVIDPKTKSIVENVYVETNTQGYIPARIAEGHPDLNLVVLKVESFEPLVPATIGDSENVKVGQWVIALGDPQGPDKTFSVGNVAATPDQDSYSDELSYPQIQSSVSVPIESFGGPLVNLRAEVIGIMVPRRLDESFQPIPGNIGDNNYAVPINLISTRIDKLVAKESAQTPYFGVDIIDLTWELRKKMTDPPSMGVLVESVANPSSAYDAGILPGDVIVAMDGNRIYSVVGYEKWINTLGIGKRCEIELSRAGEKIIKAITISNKPDGI